jgi:RNA polymerase sporulation-specific sigma factor
VTEAQIIARYYGMAVSASRRYYLPGAEEADVLQEALIALLHAARDFDPATGVPFSRFAWMVMHRRLISAVKGANTKRHRLLLDTIPPLVGQDGAAQDVIDTVPAQDDVEQTIIDRERLSIFAAVRLAPLERAAVVGFAQGDSYA